QGLQNMLPGALSQTLEQVTRVACGFTISLYLLPRGIIWAAYGLACGMVAGEVIGLAAIMLQYRLFSRPQPGKWLEKLQSRRNTLRRIWQLAGPVTVGRLLTSALSIVDAMLIPRRLLTAGHTARQATVLFGQLGGTGFTLLSFPTVFTFALAISLVPSVSEATATKSFQTIRARSAEAIRVTILFGMPFLVILFYFAEPLTALFKSVHLAPVLRILAIGGVFFYLQQTTTAILQGLGKVQLPLIHFIIASTIRIPLLYWLTGMPQFGLAGTAWAMITGFFLIAILNIAAIQRQTGMLVNLNRLGFQPVSAALCMLLTFRLLAPSLDHHLFNYPEEVIIGGLVYLIVLVLNGGITRWDIRRIISLVR
ncbi:MAG: polysaccharide biosynthesis C-terminal domain-containing protein, partial [Chitinophagales bacterium]